AEGGRAGAGPTSSESDSREAAERSCMGRWPRKRGAPAYQPRPRRRWGGGQGRARRRAFTPPEPQRTRAGAEWRASLHLNAAENCVDALLLSRIQFGFVITFHILFPAFTIGLAHWLAFLEWRWLRTQDGK